MTPTERAIRIRAREALTFARRAADIARHQLARASAREAAREEELRELEPAPRPPSSRSQPWSDNTLWSDGTGWEE